MENKSGKKSDRKMDKPVKELACEEPKPLQEKSTVEKAGETMRALKAERFPVASGDRLVGTVEGKYLERKAAGFGHDPNTTLVRGSMLKTVYYCFEDQPLEEAREIMRSNNLQHLSVVDADLRVVGTVALTDLEAEQAQQTAEDAKAEG